ncbi:MAG: hypothetical protein FJX31_09785 [Alphaproteobacteria bacterium]|nr:hypothetical protein [Alphaproteobacteria bacterium]
MKKFAIVLAAALLSLGLAPAVAMAQGTATVEAKRGDMLYNPDDKRVGNVYRVSIEGDAQLIYRSKMIAVPPSTLSKDGGKLTTSLTLDEVRKAA